LILGKKALYVFNDFHIKRMSDREKYDDPFKDQVEQDPFEEEYFSESRSSFGHVYRGDLVRVPFDKTVLILGILSIVGAFCFGVVGLIFSIMALALSTDPSRAYQTNPDRFVPSSYRQLKSGVTYGTVGLILSLLIIFYLFIIYPNVPFEF
jgi:uncharacterized membrane protein